MLILMLERTEGLGELIMMIIQIVSELYRFILTFGSFIFLFLIIYLTLNKELVYEKPTAMVLVEELVNSFNGVVTFEDYTQPFGQVYFMIFVYIFSIVLMSFLIAMFINKYEYLWDNIDALKRMKIIQLKNSSDYSRLYSGITITFFPISLIVLPFIPLMVIFKSERLNEFCLKIQYGIMIFMYMVLGIAISIPVIPVLYGMCMWNQFFITINKRTKNKCNLVLNLMLVILLNPFIIIVSIFVDVVSLPPQLLQDEKRFEYKYQQSLDYASKE